MIELCQRLFGFEAAELTPENWEALFETSAARMAAPDWADQVRRASRLQAVFLTNDFDDPLAGFDTRTYVPCLRTDDLVFQLSAPAVRERLEKATGTAVRDCGSLAAALGALGDDDIVL